MTKKKKDKSIEDYQDMIGIIGNGGAGLHAITTALIGGGLGSPIKDPRDNDVFDLGHGLSLVKDEELENNRNKYSHLCKDGKRLSDTYFRLGGMGNGFKGRPYTQLIIYPNYPKETLGNHCIIDSEGQIVLTQEKHFDYLYYNYGGVIATMGDVFYNLLTGEPIVKGSSRISSKEFLFVENKYNDEYENGVYKIELATGEFEIFN